jgi:hypothetical protein
LSIFQNLIAEKRICAYESRGLDTDR